MYSETIRATTDKIEILLPKSFVNKDLKINIIPIGKKTKTSKFDKFYGVMNIENLEEEINKIRMEWDRDL